MIFSTFMLSILGTLLTRSGIVSSVHAFGASSIGNWFSIFLAIVLVVCAFTFASRRDYLKSDRDIKSARTRGGTARNIRIHDLTLRGVVIPTPEHPSRDSGNRYRWKRLVSKPQSHPSCRWDQTGDHQLSPRYAFSGRWRMSFLEREADGCTGAWAVRTVVELHLTAMSARNLLSQC